MIGEPTRLRVGIAHRGSLRPRILVRGRSAHSSTPRLGVNAIFKMREGSRGAGGVLRRASTPAASPHRAARAEPSPSSGRPQGERRPGPVRDRPRPPHGARGAARTRSWPTSRCSWPASAPRTPSSRSDRGLPAHQRPAVGDAGRRALVGLAVEAVREVTGAPGRGLRRRLRLRHDTLPGLGAEAVILGPGDIDRAHKADEYIELAEFEAGARYMRRSCRRLLA